MGYETIRFDRPEDGIAILTLNRPKRLNAINGTLLEELDAALDEIERDDSIRVFILTGAPRADFFSVRLLRDGAIDTGYGDGAGRSTFPLSVEDDTAWAVTVTSDGSLLLAGTADVGAPDNDMAFLRLQGDPTIFADGFED